MMHAVTFPIFQDRRHELVVHGLRVRRSQRFCVLLFVLAALLGKTPVLHAATATWNPNPESDIAGYILSYGTQSGVYSVSINVGKVTTYQVTTLTPGQTYYFVVQAYDTSGLTSADSAEVVFADPVTSPPSITSLSQTSGPVGTAVTIAGANFGTTKGTSTVTFNGIAATPTSWSTVSIVVPVPAGATTGPVVVMVGGAASNSLNFTVTVPPASVPAPTLTSLSPSSGAVGTTVTIAGANFGASQGTSTVRFNGTAASPTSWSGTSISVPVPSGATSGPVVVTVGGTASNGISFTVVRSPGGITLSQRASIDGGTTTSASLAFSSNNTAGNFIAVAIRAGGSSQRFTVSDSRGNRYQQAIATNNGSDDTLAIYYAQNIAGGPNTVTVSDTVPGTMRFAILEYAGIAASNPLDVTVAAQGSGTNPSSGSVTTTGNGDLLLGAVTTANSPGFAAGSGYTIEESVPAAPGTKLTAEDRVQAVAGSASAAATLLASDNWAAALAAFRMAPSAPSSPPTLTQPANQTSAENASVSLQLVGSDPDGDTLAYSATGLPPALGVNAATGLISGTLTFSSAGTYTVTAAVSDGSVTSTKTFTWTVTNVDRPPTLTRPPNRTSARNATVSLQLLGSDPDGNTLTYSATGLPAPLTVNAATGLISGTLVSTSVGTHTVTATVSDGKLSASQTFTWTVRNVAPALSAIDFDGDGKTDLAVYNPSTGTWSVSLSSTSYTTNVSYAWGISTDLPVPGDYDGDHKTDVAVYRPSNGRWYILQSSTNYTTSVAIEWGVSTDIPVPGDYDGDGKTDLAVYRPSNGRWYILQSSTNYTTSVVHAWGMSADIPVAGDYDGDGKSDLAVYRPSNSTWYILQSSTNYTASVAYAWGASSDVPVPGDYDGDGITDLATYRPSTGNWYVSLSSTHFGTTLVVPWGTSTNVPVPGDYDGDGELDLAVFRSTGDWAILFSSTNYSTSVVIRWGVGTDVPVPGRP